MTWMIREDKLDTDQKEFINVESQKFGNIWVKGFAGSGKSVLLVHSLKNVLQKQPNAKVAIVVYTLSLIDLFKTGMRELNLSPTIPVMTYYDFVDKNKENFDYIFCDEVQDLPAKVLYAMGNRAGKIIVAGDSNQSIYDTDPKWNEEVVNPSQVGDIINARAFPLNTIHRLTRSIIAAVQKLLPTMNIWGAKRDMTKQDVNIRLCEASSESEEVKYIYQEAQKGTAVGDSCAILLPKHDLVLKMLNLLLTNQDKPKWTLVEKYCYYISVTDSQKEVVKTILSKKVVKIKKWDSTVYFGYYFNEQQCKNDIAILSENKIHSTLITESWGADYESLNLHLSSNGIKAQFIGNGYGSLKNAENNKDVIVMTYHSSKGLDFDNVFLPFVNTNLSISPNKEETLFMVALTRSRKNLYLTYYGYTHDLVDRFKGECSTITISDLMNVGKTGRQVNNFDF